MQRELEERRAEAERQKAELARMERAHAEARQRIENLNVAVKVAEQEKQLLGQNLEQARAQVEVERAERAKVQEQTTQLAQGVGQLAEKSGELTREIRDNRPVNPNTIFGEFLANRVQLQVTTQKPGLFSPSFRERDSQTVLVSDGTRAYAIMHISDTPFAWNWENPPNYQKIAGRLTFGSTNAPVSELQFLELDPRVLAAPLNEELAGRLGAKIYALAKDPFKFPDVVLVRADDGRYGETQVRIDANNRNYLRLDNRIVTRIFGEISPKRGDLVFAKTGEIIGIMVNNEYCAVLGNFAASHTFQLGENVTQPGTEAVFRDLSARLRRLDARLQ
jgi:X-X-X-Leu-X-X-Gly heptad repeat protein